MGHVAEFNALPYREVAPGVKRAPITGPEMKEMAAEVIKLGPGATLTESVPSGCDRYLFTLDGAVTVGAGGDRHAVQEQAFVTVQERTTLTVANPGGGEATLIGVTAPPTGGARRGFSGGLAVAARATTRVHHVPEELKRRIYFVGKDAAHSERAHAMIVVYEKDTVTGLHMHPNADSMFVMLSGKTRFTIDGKDAVVGPGQAACFPSGDRHGLRVAEGDVSFLEFHVPAEYATVKG